MNKFIKDNKLLFAILIGVTFGVLIGAFEPDLGVKIGFLGELFLNALKMVVLPLIIVTITLSIIRLGDIKKFGAIGFKTFVYYALTTGIAVIIGILVVITLKPGVGGGAFLGALPENISAKEGMTFIDILMELFHPNLVVAAFEFKILPLVSASILFGLAFISIPGEIKVVEELFSTFDKAIMKLVGWIMWFTPIGVMALIASKLGQAGGGAATYDLIAQLGKYFIAVILGLSIHGFIVLPLILMLLARRNPLKYIKGMGEALLTAFSTASSSATLPITMENVVKNGKIPKKIANFVLPLGATINMDGTALYEAVAVVFIAQSYGITLGPESLVVIFITATLAAVGAAGIPEAGLVTMILVLQAVGLPIEGIGLILAIDWLLDRFRTTINVWGDSVGAAVIDRWENPEADRSDI